MSVSTLVMYGIAALALLIAIVVACRPARSEAGAYRRRITAAMAFAIALILGTFATVFYQAGGVA